MNDRYVYLNGDIIRANEARISPLDRGFLLGDGFFETTRIINGVPFRFDDHMRRLTEACDQTGWNWGLDCETLRCAIGVLAERNDVVDGYMRVTVSRGAYDGGLTDLEAVSPTILMDVRDMDLAPLGNASPITLAPAPFVRNETSPVTAVKSVSYQESLLALARGRDAGADEVFFFNSQGNLAEGAVSNIFVIADEEIITPSEDQGILSGIGRKVVLDACRENNILVEEGCISMEQMLAADELFCTNSLRGVMPVKKIVDTQPQKRFEGEFTKRIQRLFVRCVRRECKLGDGNEQV